ncbi:hypothetical protein ACFLZX_01145 [Nanoarchaeota archaeon]
MQFYSHHPMADYFNAMDSEKYGRSAPQDAPRGMPTGAPRGGGESGDNSEPVYGVKDIGMSVPLGISAANVAGVYSKIRMGTGAIELGFPGAVSSQRGAHTPGVYGHDQRQALREMGAINEVTFTTHGAYNIMGMMGRDERGNFSISNARISKDEIARAIDFAGDVAGSGSVVMHSGEFERPMTDMVVDDPTGKHNLNIDPKTGRMLFMRRHSELYDANFVLLDKRTSQVMETVQKDRMVAFPDYLKATSGYEGEDIDGNRVTINPGDYVDYWKRKIPFKYLYHPTKGPVPKYDPESGRFATRYLTFGDFKRIAEEENKWFEEINGRKPNQYEVRYPEEAFLHATLITNESHSRGWALQYGREAEDHIRDIRRLKEAYNRYKKLEESTPKEELWKLVHRDELTRGILGTGGKFLIPEQKLPSEWLDEAIRTSYKNLEFAKQASTSQEQQAKDTEETRRNLITPVKRLEEHPTRFYAELGIRAWERSKDPEKPIFLAIENLFPERFGGHPEELSWLIEKSRDRMVEFLTEKHDVYGVGGEVDQLSTGKQKIVTDKTRLNQFYQEGMSEEEARKLAEQHIGVTLDTGHLNLWRKFWMPIQGKSIEENDLLFNDWYLKQIEKLAKKRNDKECSSYR